MVTERCCLSISDRVFRKLLKACCGLALISSASLLALIPMPAKASLKSSDCTLAVCSLVNSALIAVPATSGDLPKLIKAADNAAACSVASPNCLACPPIRCMTSTISDSLAADVLPSVLMASPSLPTSSIGNPNTLAIFAAASPASSAVMPNATDISPAILVNSPNFSIGIPN